MVRGPSPRLDHQTDAATETDQSDKAAGPAVAAAWDRQWE